MIRPFATLFFSFLLLLSVSGVLHAFPKVEGPTQTGTIIETMDASGYTYMLLDSVGREMWVAIPETKVEKGQQVTFAEGMEMKNFYSKTLDRTFDTILFSAGLTENQSGSPQPGKNQSSPGNSFAEAVKNETEQPVQQPMGSSSGSAGATVPYLEAKVERAEGENAITVGEAFSEAEAKNNTIVKIRAKVVKVSPNIMGRNWIHVQDGSGDPMNNTHDLVITTDETIRVDDIILIEGKLAANKDFGFGYKYDVIVEEARTLQ